MSDISLNNIASGYNLSKINDNFDVVEEVINNEVLHTVGGNNTMSQQLDMDSYKILNLPAPTSGTEPLRKGDVVSDTTGATIQYVDDSIEESIQSRDFVSVKTLQQAIENTSAQEGDYVRILDRGNGLFQYAVGQTPNGRGVIDAPASGMSLVVIVNSEPANVKWFGAGKSLSNNDTQAFYDAASATNFGKVVIPTGTYAVNLVLGTSVKFEGEAIGSGNSSGANFGTRLIPFTVGEDCVRFEGPSVFCGLSNVSIESNQIPQTPTYQGRGLVLEAFSPDFITASTFKHIYIRGFAKGMQIDCDINASEVFDNYFEDIECIDCLEDSFVLRGVYNTYTKLFATQCGDFALFNDGSNCIFDSVVGDGRMAFRGGGQHVKNCVIEAIHANPTANPSLPAFEINGNSSTFVGCRLNGVSNDDYQIGFSVFGSGHTLDNFVVQGVMPETPIIINGGSSGTISNFQAVGALNKITESLATNWVFIHNVSDVWSGATVKSTLPTDGLWTPSLERNGSSLTQNVSQGVWTKTGRIVEATFRVNVLSVESQGSGFWFVGGLPFVSSDSQASIRYSGVVGQSEVFPATGAYLPAGSQDLTITFGGQNVSSSCGTGSITAHITYETDE